MKIKIKESMQTTLKNHYKDFGYTYDGKKFIKQAGVNEIEINMRFNLFIYSYNGYKVKYLQEYKEYYKDLNDAGFLEIIE